MFCLQFQRALKFGAKVRLLRKKGCRKMRQNLSQNATKCTFFHFVTRHICNIENEQPHPHILYYYIYIYIIIRETPQLPKI